MFCFPKRQEVCPRKHTSVSGKVGPQNQWSNPPCLKHKNACGGLHCFVVEKPLIIWEVGNANRNVGDMSKASLPHKEQRVVRETSNVYRAIKAWCSGTNWTGKESCHHQSGLKRKQLQQSHGDQKITEEEQASIVKSEKTAWASTAISWNVTPSEAIQGRGIISSNRSAQVVWQKPNMKMPKGVEVYLLEWKVRIINQAAAGLKSWVSKAWGSSHNWKRWCRLSHSSSWNRHRHRRQEK